MRSLIMLPGPTNVPDRVMTAMLTPIINHRSELFRQLHRRLVEKAQRVFETESDLVILSSSKTGGVEAAVTNTIRAGDIAIVPVFGEFSARLADHIETAGGRSIRVAAPFGDAPRIASLEDAFASNTDVKALYVVYNETSTGVTFRWLKEAGQLAAEHGSLFIVDAISILGGDELPVDRLGIDMCITGSQKCLAAPPGLALLSVGAKAKQQILDNPPLGQYFNLAKYIEFAKKGETPYTPSLPLFYALDEALSLVLEEGMSARIQRHRKCADAFYAGFQAMGLTPFAKEEVRSNTVISIKYPPRVEDRSFRNMMEHNYRILVAGGFGDLKGTIFRVGCMGEISEYYVLTTLSAISTTLNAEGFPNDPRQVTNAAASKLR